jgi:hypothetical protein
MSDRSRPEVKVLGDLRTDLASTHRSTAGDAEPVGSSVEVDVDLATLDRDGYVILRDLVSPDTLSDIRSAVAPLLEHTGRNGFEGHATQRIYSVLAKTRAVDRLVDHPLVMALLDKLLLPNWLLSQLQVINLLPGELAQLLHPDDGVYPVPRPRRALGVATIWAIDRFTESNGATVVVPGSHRWGDERTPTPDDSRVAVAMEPGSCVLFLGTLWHGGGANISSGARLAVTAQYCEPWLRPQEAFTLSTTPELVARLSEPLIRMLGYSIHPPFLGMVDGMHPKRLLTP